MKLAVIFEVPDGQADTYADVAKQMIQRHAFAEQEHIKHWSFDREMRPVGAVLVEPAGGGLTEAIQAAHREVDQDQPWLPGYVFKMHDGLKPLLLWILDLLE